MVAPPRRYAQNLAVHVFSTRRQLGHAAAFDFIDLAQKLLAQKATIRVLFASAPSQLDFVASLKRNHMFLDWERVHAFHLDEYVGAGPETAYGFANWIQTHLAGELPFGRFEAIEGSAQDPDAECQRYADLLKEEEIDIACLGIGENGHIAFNDPHAADFDDLLAVKPVTLDEICRQQQFHDAAVAGSSFFKDLDAVPRQALTLTIPTIMKAENILCIVPAQNKSMAVWRTLNEEISPACPASVLRRHANAHLYLDHESASLLGEEE